MSFIKDLFSKHSLSDMNDEQTRKTLANNHVLRTKIAGEIIEHIEQLESRCGKSLWNDFESYRGKSALSELITKNAVGSFCDRNNYDWFELDNPYYCLFYFAMDCFITDEKIQEHACPEAKNIASLIRKETIIINEEENITELDVFVDENFEKGTIFDCSYRLFISKYYKENGIQNRVLFAISCLIMLSNMQEILMLALEEKESEKDFVQLKVRHLKSPGFDHRFYRSAIIIHFKNKENLLNSGQFVYENGSEFLKGNKLVDIVKNQTRYTRSMFEQFKFSLFKTFRALSKDTINNKDLSEVNSFTRSSFINKQYLIKQLNLHFCRYFKYDGRNNMGEKEKAKLFFKLLNSPDIDCIEIINKK